MIGLTGMLDVKSWEQDLRSDLKTNIVTLALLSEIFSDAGMAKAQEVWPADAGGLNIAEAVRLVPDLTTKLGFLVACGAGVVPVSIAALRLIDTLGLNPLDVLMLEGALMKKSQTEDTDLSCTDFLMASASFFALSVQGNEKPTNDEIEAGIEGLLHAAADIVNEFWAKKQAVA